MTDSFKAFVERWTTPTVLISLLLLILGGITWGVQLNVNAVEQTRANAIQNQRLTALEDSAQSAAIINARTATLLDALTRQVRSLEERISRNEEWLRDNTNHSHDRP